MQNESHPLSELILRQHFTLYEKHSFQGSFELSSERTLHTFLHNDKLSFYLQERIFQDINQFDLGKDESSNLSYRLLKTKVVFYHYSKIEESEADIFEKDQFQFLEKTKHIKTEQNLTGFLQFISLFKTICQNVKNVYQIQKGSLLSKTQVSHSFCNKEFKLLIYRRLRLETYVYEEFSYVMSLQGELISMGEELEGKAAYTFIEDLRLFLLHNQIKEFISINKLNLAPIKLKEFLEQEEIKQKQINLDNYCSAPCFLTFPLHGLRSRHFALYIGNNEIYHINALSDRDSALGKLKATFLRTNFVNFSSMNVFEYLIESGRTLADVEIINFFVCPFTLKEIIFRADLHFAEKQAQYNLLSMNCEHYVNKVVFGVARSLQADYYTLNKKIGTTDLTASKAGNLIYQLKNEKYEVYEDVEAVKKASAISYKVQN